MRMNCSNAVQVLRRLFLPAGMAALVIIGGLCPLAATPLHAAAAVPRILVLNSYNPGYDWSEDEMAGVRAGLSKSFSRTELYVEYLDTKTFPAKKHFSRLADLLEAKYAGRSLDAIIAMDNAALEFASLYRSRISPGTPLVFCGINGYLPSMIAGQSRITGVAEYHDSIGTLGLALQLHPSVRTVVVIHDYTDTGLAIRRELEKRAVRYHGIKLEFLDEMPLEQAVAELKGLTAGHLVLLLSYTVEKGGGTFNHSEAARLISSASPVPVYSVYAEQLGFGVTGGRMIGGQSQGQKAAELVARIIGGESPEKLPVITGDLSHSMFDYRMLEKYEINRAKLPADVVLINKPHSTFAINKTVFWMGGVFTLLCTVVLAIMFLNIRKRRRLENLLLLKVEEYQQSQEELQSTEEMLRVQLEVIEESSQKFKAVFEHSPITVALSTLPDETFYEVNKAFVDMFGFSRKEVVGKTTSELGVWRHESDRDSYLKLLRDDGSIQNYEVQMRRKGGEEFTAFFSGSLLEIAGQPFALSTVMDISEQKRLQNQLFQSQKMDVVGQLAGGIAHDFNNMLAGIMAAAELLKRRLPDDEKNSKLVDTIIAATTRSASLTRELLSFSRKGAEVSHSVRINETINAVISLLELTLDKQIQLTTRLAGGNPVVWGDQTQLQNALLNLGINARDAMPQGGTLAYATAVKNMDEYACRLSGVALAPGRYLEITVSDTGIGMTKEVAEHIFEPFFTTKEPGKGTGLGLATAYGTVRSHAGDLHVLSQPGVGSIFKIYLPMMEEGTAATIRCGDAVVGDGGILLVDDEEFLRDVGRALLEDLGYTVYLAENGEHALEMFSGHRSEISLVIMDMIMPKMGGEEAFLRLREQAPELKVLICSGFSRDGTGDELVDLGANGFIQKPYNRSELSRAVAEALGR